MNRKWTDDDTRWLKANFARLDVQKISYQLGVPLEEIQKRVKALKLVVVEPAAARKAPTSLKEAKKELSAARREYEKAMDAFHKRRFDEAARRFEDVVEKYPDEKEFRDRAKMYLAACRNGKKTRAAVPGDAEDLYHSAVFEKNRGNLEKALDLLKKTAGKRDGDGRLHYLAACCHALSGDVDQAITNLKKAIAADDQNRIQARLDTDLVALRSHQSFAEIVAGGA